MPSARKFHRMVVTYEVLSEEPLGDFDLRDLHEMCTDGPCSGMWTGRDNWTVNGKAMADLLTRQGSDPGFFRLDEDGNDLEDPE